jgi:amino acid adenylation domain-containing protein
MASEWSAVYSDQPPSDDVLQYADYSEWQNDWLRKEDSETKAAIQAWKQTVAASQPALALPLERKRASGSLSWATVPVPITPGAFSRIPAEQLEDFFLACWQVFLWLITGQQEFVLEVLSDGRNHEEFAAGVGIFARNLPLAASFENEKSFASFLTDSANHRAGALDAQDYFAADSVTEPIPVGFASAGSPSPVAEFARTSPACGSRIQLFCPVTGSAAQLVINFDSAYFDQQVIEQLAESFAVLCTAAAAEPSIPVGALSITTDEQRRRVVMQFNRTAAEYPKSKTIHQLFEEQAGLHPERPALRYGQRELSFGELNRGANRIANVLRSHGVDRNVPVALCVERSAEMIVGLLGILKAGGCYVPLIPDNPKARLAHQLAETGAPVILTEEKHLNQLPEFKGKIICLDRDKALLAAVADTNPAAGSLPDDLVYVIYTSGSTGIPKGVAVRHSNLVNYSHFICRRLQLENHPQGLNFATVSTISADLGNTCIFPSLISGGCLHVIGYETAMSPALFAEYASQHPVDVLKITPSHLSTLLSSGQAVLPKKYLVLGGEATRWDLIERIRKASSCAIFNHYGPTEATVGCCTFSVDQTDVSQWEPASVPVGRPIANDQVYILDSQMNPVPVGVAGELCAGGAGLALGYLNQPEQTAERFVRNPFSDDPNSRLYRTGDLARFLPDGSIEFLGRIDQQVKIRGFRVEPAEIENVLKRHPSVKQAAVIPYDDKTGEKRLAAYFTGRSRPEELRAFLAQELPDYMVPAAFVPIDSLPITANGKLDVKALPSPEQQSAARELVAPRNSDEEKLVEIWQGILKLDRVGVTDDFFELGGHSLLATQIISRIRDRFRVQMPLHVFLQNPTIAALASQIGQCPVIESEQEEMARLLQEIEGMSEEEAEKLLTAELNKSQNN